MLNILIQILTLLYTVIFSFGVPYIFGLDNYGEFIITNAAAFLIHRTLSIAAEPIMGMVTPKEVFFSAIFFYLIFFLISLVINFFYYKIGSLLFLAGLLVNSAVIASLQAMRRLIAHVLFLLLLITIIVVLLYQAYMYQGSISLILLMSISTSIPALLGFIYALHQSLPLSSATKIYSTFFYVIRNAPLLFSITSCMNLITSAFPLLLSSHISNYNMGIFRVSTAIVQSSTSVFPLGIKAIMRIMQEQKSQFYFFSRLRLFSSVYFMVISVILITISYFLPHYSIYLKISYCIPLYFTCIIAERFLAVRNDYYFLVFINLISCTFCILAIFASINTSNNYNNLDVAFYVYTGTLSIHLILLFIRINLIGDQQIYFFILIAIAFFGYFFSKNKPALIVTFLIIVLIDILLSKGSIRRSQT